MLKIRSFLLSVLLSIVIASGTYFVVMAFPASSKATAPSAASSCPVVHSTYQSNQDLWRILNGRYERRIRLPY